MIKGIWKDEIYDSYGNLWEVREGSNIWVEPAPRFVMGSITGQINPGNIHLAVGIGLPEWDTAVPYPKPNVYQTELTNEVFRKAVDSMTYMRIGHGTAKEGTLTEIYDPWRENPATSLYWGRFEQSDLFNGATITITSGTNAGEIRTVSDYDQVTGKITVSSAYPEACDETTQYEFTPSAAAVPTNAIEFRTVLDYTDLTSGVYLREMGLFGGDGADTSGGGYMVDAINHQRIWKDSSVKVVRFITLSFNP